MEGSFAAVPLRSRLEALSLRPRTALVPVTRPLEWPALPVQALALTLLPAELVAPFALAFPPVALTLAAELVVPVAALSLVAAWAAALSLIAAWPAALPKWPRAAADVTRPRFEGRPARTAASIVVWRFHCAERYSGAQPGCTAVSPWTPPAQAGMVA
jgi:hypothetical protein